MSTVKYFTAAEKERLIELVNGAQAAVAEQDKWVAFLQKQHDVTAEWSINFDGFTAPLAKQDDSAPPAPDEHKPPKKSKTKALATE